MTADAVPWRISLLAPGGVAPGAGARLLLDDQPLRLPGGVEQVRVESVARGIQQAGDLRQVLRPDHDHKPRLILERRGELEYADSQNGIEQDR